MVSASLMAFEIQNFKSFHSLCKSSRKRSLLYFLGTTVDLSAPRLSAGSDITTRLPRRLHFPLTPTRCPQLHPNPTVSPFLNLRTTFSSICTICLQPYISSASPYPLDLFHPAVQLSDFFILGNNCCARPQSALLLHGIQKIQPGAEVNVPPH